MADVYTRAERSALMAKVRARGNLTTEEALAKVFRAEGWSGWRRQRALGGRAADGGRFRLRPDFVFAGRRLAVFVDGCFWHGCPLHATQPKQNAKFWREKIARNQARDRLVTRRLRARGWRVARFWEHELTRKYERRLLARLRRAGLVAASAL